MTSGVDGKWRFVFDNMPKYADGKLIDYTITEDKIDGYTTTINGYTITNKHRPYNPYTYEFVFYKKWNNVKDDPPTP